MPRPKLVNELAWSKSRAEKLSICARQYWLQYYGAWGGWERDASPEQKRRYMLKALTGRKAWAGSTVHNTIKRVLDSYASNIIVGVDGAVMDAKQRMRDEFAQSRRGTYRQIKKGFGLLEHEYAQPITDDEWKETVDHVERCIRNFYRSSTFTRALVQRGKWKTIDESPGDKDLPHFLLDGVKIYAVIDFAFSEDDGTLEIVDWKTGRAKAGDTEQLSICAAFAHHTWIVPYERMRGRLVYLDELDEPSFDVTDEDIALFESHARESIGVMRSKLCVVDTNETAEEDFARTDNKRMCTWCVFQSECTEGDELATMLGAM